MHTTHHITSILLGSFLTLLVLLLAGCDSVEPQNDALLVVEGYIDADKPLPLITLHQAQSLNEATLGPHAPAVQDADLRIMINDHTIRYRSSLSHPGKYEPVDASLSTVPARSRFRAEIEWHGQFASSEDIVPPPIRIDSVYLSIPSAPVTAILIDTLRLDTPQVGARKGFIYPIDATIWWTPDFVESGVDSSYWVETRLRPNLAFSSRVLDVFLLSEEVQPERDLSTRATSSRSWTGVYAVPVEDSLATVPDHSVSVQLIRSSEAYALFTASRNVPERREPISNIDGAIGIMAGISLDSLTVHVVNGVAEQRPY